MNIFPSENDRLEDDHFSTGIYLSLLSLMFFLIFSYSFHIFDKKLFFTMSRGQNPV